MYPLLFVEGCPGLPRIFVPLNCCSIENLAGFFNYLKKTRRKIQTVKLKLNTLWT